ncbi:MAG: hypothetical protein AB7L66_13600 [Gemmatimonadales bacterium]
MTTLTARPTAAEELFERLARTETPKPTIVSCYVRLSPAVRTKQAYLVSVMNRVREVESSLSERGLTAAEGKRVAADLERVVRWLAKPTNLPALPGVALFAAAEIGLFEVVPLPRVHRDRVGVDTRPLLHELLDAQETLGHYLAVAIDRHRARFFHVTATGTQELAAMVPLARRGGKFVADRKDAPGWGEFRYHQRIQSEQNRHYARVAREIGRLTHARPYRGLVVLGPTAHTAALTSFLTGRQLELLLGTARMNPAAVTPAQVGQTAWRLQWNAERRDEARLVARVEAATGTGWAVNGLQDTLLALGRGQVRELILPDGAEASGYRCGADGLLVAERKDCVKPAAATPIENLVDHAIEDALRQGAQVVVIDDSRAAAAIDTLAATLRFRTRTR